MSTQRTLLDRLKPEYRTKWDAIKQEYSATHYLGTRELESKVNLDDLTYYTLHSLNLFLDLNNDFSKFANLFND